MAMNCSSFSMFFIVTWAEWEHVSIMPEEVTSGHCDWQSTKSSGFHRSTVLDNLEILGPSPKGTCSLIKYIIYIFKKRKLGEILSFAGWIDFSQNRTCKHSSGNTRIAFQPYFSRFTVLCLNLEDFCLRPCFLATVHHHNLHLSTFRGL